MLQQVFFKGVLHILSPLHFYMNFRISLSSSPRKPTGILNEIQKSQTYKFISHLEEYYIFT